MVRHTQSLPWRDPSELFLLLSRNTQGPLAFLHSSLVTGYSGRYSWLAWDAGSAIDTHDWATLHEFLPPDDAPPAFGYLSYEMLHGLEEVPSCAPSILSPPRCQFFLPRHYLRFDHKQRVIDAWGDEATALIRQPTPLETPATEPPFISDLFSNMSRAEYLAHVEATREAIAGGAFYQANITRKFFGRFQQIPEAASLFLRLQEVSPAPYGAYLRFGELHILSSSPEQFLRLTKEGRLETRPIKGTLGRATGETEDAARTHLHRSAKDRAENLMIVDLMRNDLSKVCVPSSIDASRLFEVDSFSTLHHLSSTVSGRLAADRESLDAVQAAFPPGSMTGAPKIAAIRWCSKVEGMERGIYSGALGWMNRRSLELSVVIRTLVLQRNSFEFQVGGGIVADSNPENEWRETLSKARGICRALALEEERLENI